MATRTRAKAKTRWTVVQHSGAGYGGKEGFSQALEVRTVETLADQTKVVRAGGKLFDSWQEAETYCEEQNYGTGESIYCNVPGTFSDVEIDGLKVYIPATAVATKG